jgi:formylglycine-generating enzyme required for sulfatase activity
LYKISKSEVTNAQYAEFLNAVAASDPNGLYNTDMGSAPGGITRDGSPGTHTYTTITGRENKPVIFTSFYDALRFANWLHNGKRTGSQDGTTTEDGAYTITLDGITANSITRNADAIVFLTSEDEWYKAAYYDAISASYFTYPTSSDVAPTCALPGSTPNTANCGTVVGDVTDVGGYTASPSPYGTFDQGGNAAEWTETISGSGRIVLGSQYGSGPHGSTLFMVAGRSEAFDPLVDPSLPWVRGFRVATIPEPSTGFLVGAGLAAFAVGRRLARVPAG